MGLESKPQMVQEFGGAVADPQLQAYVTDLGTRLSKVTEGDNPKLPWSFTLLNSDVVNAFALPGGQVFVTRGLAKRLTNEAQLAGVMGHEIGHATARHGGQRITKQLGLEIVVKAIEAGSGSQQITDLSNQVAQITLLAYSRDEENQADSLGLRYMSRLNYNPIGQVQVMQILADLQAQSGTKVNEWVSSHPDPASRVSRLTAEINTSYKATQTDPKFVLNEQRFRDSMLKRLAALPPAPDAVAVLAGGSALPDSRSSRLSIGSGGGWCLHCAAIAAGKSPEQLITPVATAQP